MKKEFLEDLLEIIPLLAISSVMASYLKGLIGMREYIKSVMASFIVGLPMAFVAEYFITSPNAWLLKDAIILVSGSFGICLFNGFFKIFKSFESDPIHTVKNVKKLKDGNDGE